MRMARAVFAGVAGAFAMSVAGIVFGELGIAISLENVLGGLLGFDAASQTGWTAGFVFHLMLGAWFAVLYAQGFERLEAGGWSLGATFSIAHVLVAGFGVALLAPFVAGGAPAAFMSHLGLAGVCAFVLIHLAYGAVVGSVYRALRTPVYVGRDAMA